MLHKHYMRAHVWLRVFIFGFTLAAALCMGLNKQTSLVAGYQFEASYKSSPTFKFFVIGNAIACGYTLLSMFFITNLVEGYLFHLFDLVLMGLVMASAASTTAIAYVGKKGNENIGWNMAMKSYIWLQTVDGSIQQVEEEVAMSCPMICREVLQTGMGSSKNYAISLPERVNPAVLGLILDYCRFHQVPGRSNKERKSFDEKFIRTDVDQLCELASAADSLQLRPLVDITSRALARIIEGKTPEEIRETFHLPDDLTEEEKLEPVRIISDDPRIRLLNRLYAKKRKELKERQKLKDVDVQDEREELADERSVDDLLSFINGRDGDSKCVRPSKHKKKNRRRNEPKVTSKIDHQKTNQKVENIQSPVCNESGNNFSCSPSRSSEMDGSTKDAFSVEFEFEDDDIDDDLDPAIKEELDREVEEFARRLNSDWLSIGERRLVPDMMNGNGSLRKYTGLALGDR